MLNIVPFGVIHVAVSLALAAILILVYRRLPRTDFLLYWALYWIDIAINVAASQVALPLLKLMPWAPWAPRLLTSFNVCMAATYPALMICAGLSAGRRLAKRTAWRWLAGAAALGIPLAVFYYGTQQAAALTTRPFAPFRAISTGLAVFFFAWHLAANGSPEERKARTGLVGVSLFYGVHNLLLGFGVYGSGGAYSPWVATAGILFQFSLTIALTYGAIERAGEASREKERVVTDLVRAQSELREREEKLRVLFNFHPNLQSLVRVEPGGRFVNEAFNQALTDWVGQFIPDPGVFLERGRDELLRALGIPDSDVEKADAAAREIVVNKTPMHFDLTLMLDAGRRREIAEVTIVPILNGGGECTHLLWTGRFITERKREEEELRKRRRELAEAQSIGHIGSWTWDVLADKVVWSDEMFRILGFEPQQFPPGLPAFLERVHPSERESVGRAIQAHMESRMPHDFEHRIVRPDGTERIVHDKSVIQLDSSGQPLRVFGTVHDVTEERLTATREVARLRRMKQLSELSMMLAGDPATVFERLVRMIGELFEVRAVRLSEIAGHDLIFRTVYENGKVASDAGSCPLAITPCATAVTDKDIRIYENVRELFPRSSFLRDHDAYSLCAFPSLDNEEKVVAVTCLVHDKPRRFTEEDLQILRVIGQRIATEFDRLKTITERARMLEELRENQRRLEEAQQMAHLGSYTSDATTGRMVWSDELYRIYELDPARSVPSRDAVMAAVHPDDRALIQKTREDLLGQNGPFEFEHRLLMPDGRIKHLLVRGTASSVADGRSRSSGTAQDITERKNAEREKEKLQAQLNQAQKMESIGQLAGGIAHDFNNLLTVINGYSDMLMRQLTSPELKYAERINKAGESAASLTRQLLAFSRMEATHPEPVRLNGIVAESGEMLTRLVGDNVELKTSLQASPDQVLADPNQIHQCLMNLVANARDAMPEGGRLTIETGNVEVAPSDIPIGSTAAPGPHVRLTVRDSGIGMDEETGRRIFEPFFTTKEKGKGTGLGLSTVYGIVGKWQAFLKVVSDPGRGSEFSIYLPLNTTVKPVGNTPTAENGDFPAASETLLVVDDQDMVREFMVSSLRMSGYTVLEARNGAEALQVIDRNGAAIHLMLTDVMMPGMGGKELAVRANALQPSMKVLFMTGYADVSISGDEIIMKPFTPKALLDRLRSLLHATPETLTEP